MATTKHHGTAEYKGTYCGWTEVRLEAIRTKRRGETVTRYRWRGDLDQPSFVSPFATVERAIAAARSFPAIMRNVVEG